MDYETEFWESVEASVALMKRRGTPTTTWTADDGMTVTGWRALFDHSYGPTTEGNPASDGFWRETWGHSFWILDVDGKFWSYSFSGEDGSSLNRSELRETIQPAAASGLVGRKGKPFSTAKEAIERLPYQ